MSLSKKEGDHQNPVSFMEGVHPHHKKRKKILESHLDTGYFADWNCSDSVEPSNAVVEEVPPEMTLATSSKYPVPTSR